MAKSKGNLSLSPLERERVKTIQKGNKVKKQRNYSKNEAKKIKSNNITKNREKSNITSQMNDQITP